MSQKMAEFAARMPRKTLNCVCSVSSIMFPSSNHGVDRVTRGECAVESEESVRGRLEGGWEVEVSMMNAIENVTQLVHVREIAR